MTITPGVYYESRSGRRGYCIANLDISVPGFMGRRHHGILPVLMVFEHGSDDTVLVSLHANGKYAPGVSSMWDIVSESWNQEGSSGAVKREVRNG